MRRAAAARAVRRAPRFAAPAALALVLVACGGGDEPADTTQATAPPPATAPPSPPATPTTPPPPSEPSRPELPADVEVSFAGQGARGAWVLRRSGRSGDPVVLFLHGWTAVDPALYGPWLTHLVRRNATVVYPVYQDAPFLAPDVAFDGVVAGVRAALAEQDLPRAGWVAAGHSAGGALAADYAVRAADLGLPPARGVFAAYPGRQIRGIPLKLPEIDPAGIPARTRLIALYGADDQTVGSTTAKRTIARARTEAEALIRVDDPAVDDHLGPQRAGPETREQFWRRLDALVATVQG